jgi:methylmalonyl-CoA mutase
MQEPAPYKPKHPVRIVSAAALFDGHDAAINVMRRILQATGVEIIHLGHNRSVEEVALAAVQEDAQGVALTSYQGGHVEYFTYLRERLDALGAKHTRIVGGGGGVIVPREIEELHRRGIDRIFSPEDGRNLGLQGMINLVVERCDFALSESLEATDASPDMLLARTLSRVENGTLDAATLPAPAKRAPVVGLTGTGGAGKSSLTDELVRRFVNDFPDKRVAVLCIDPTKKKTGGALLGDRIRMNSLSLTRAAQPGAPRGGASEAGPWSGEGASSTSVRAGGSGGELPAPPGPSAGGAGNRVFMRSLATRGSGSEVSAAAKNVLAALQSHGFDLILVETAGIGQGDSEIVEISDTTLYVMTAEYGAPSQLEKIEMLDHADFVAINKFTRRGSLDALRDVRRQIIRNKKLFSIQPEELMVFGTSAAHFADAGVDALYAHLVGHVSEKHGLGWASRYEKSARRTTDTSKEIVPPGRERYLSEISGACRDHHRWAREQADLAAELEAIEKAITLLGGPSVCFEAYGARVATASGAIQDLAREHDARLARLEPTHAAMLREWDAWAARYAAPKYEYEVRGKKVSVEAQRTTLSELTVPKVALPRFRGAGDRLFWRLTENVPGEFPYTAGTFPFKRTGEDPTRMFAGEGPSERTNQRFHLLAAGQPAARLSTAFDSITLYGEDPDERPDIYGKIGESGVSISTVEEAEQLYAGFDLCHPATSVSMTINGPAPTVLAFYVNTAIRQRCAAPCRPTSSRRIRPRTPASSRPSSRCADGRRPAVLHRPRGAQLLLGVDQRLPHRRSRREPGHQLAFTLANGFTFVEYYRARGMKVDDFAPNLSFFFSNGMDPEYTVIGRVARRIWAIAMRDLYGAGRPRSRCSSTTSRPAGRSLHAQEIEFNDIRTTLQALLRDRRQLQQPAHQRLRRGDHHAHRGVGAPRAGDPAHHQPRARAGRRTRTRCRAAYFVEQLTDLVEEAVLAEFERSTARGGVLGAMELHVPARQDPGRVDALRAPQARRASCRSSA